MKKNAVINLAAGEKQILVINKASEMGYAVIAVDRSPQAPGFALADEKLCLSTYEPQPIIERLRVLSDSYEFKAVLTRSSGPSVVTAATISKALGLPGVSPKTAETFIYKSDFIESCRRLSIPAPQHLVISDKKPNFHDVAFPCIVKPSLSLVGQKAVRVVANEDELNQKVIEIAADSFDDRIEIESFEPGYDIILVSMVSKGQLFPCILLDEINHITETGKIAREAIAVPSVFTGTIVEDRILTLARSLITAFKIDTTPLLLSCRSEVKGFPRVIECHLDLGGDLILDQLFPASTQFDFVKFAIEVMAGQQVAPVQADFKPTAILFTENETEACKTVSGEEYQNLIEKTRSNLIRVSN